MSSLIKCCAVLLLLSLAPIAGGQATLIDYAAVVCPDHILERAGERAAAVRCGRARLPEDRHAPEKGRGVDLFVLRIQPQSKTDYAPILHLAGGPGDAASGELEFWLGSAFQRDYEIILVDQRGTGLSRPSLDCPEYGAAEADWLRACHSRLLAAGVDLSQFQALSVVQDIRDLLDALELEQVNLYGVSYGSRLALLLAKIAPERIRAMALDGVYPPPRYDLAELASNSARSLERLFADCASDAACHAAYPELRGMFFRVIGQLNATPAELYHLGESTGWHLNGDQFLAWTIGVLRHKDALPALPALIAAFEAGVHDQFVSIDASVNAPSGHDRAAHSEGFELSVRCSEGARLAAAGREGADDLTVSEAILRVTDPVAQRIGEQCALWDVPPAPAMIAQPVLSDAPALLLSGAYDPATPPHWARFAALGLSRGWHVVFPHLGHGVLEAEECAARLLLAFLRDPLTAPTDACLALMKPPDFREWAKDGD